MKRLLGVLAVSVVLTLPALAQSGYQYPDRDSGSQYPDRPSDDRGQSAARMSPNDQREFDHQYQEWQKAKAKNDRDDVEKHARRMNEMMARYNIPPDTPYDEVARGNGYSRRDDSREFQGRFSPEDQRNFDNAYDHWLHERREGDRRGVAEQESRMQEIMAHYNIPRDVPYDELASRGRGY
ncbi:MAG TPA: hypothetical protein VJQ82_15370 [Terriglobales bacterium]|nr:hypothetical protein [Terriglobales bacterium]